MKRITTIILLILFLAGCWGGSGRYPGKSHHGGYNKTSSHGSGHSSGCSYGHSSGRGGRGR